MTCAHNTQCIAFVNTTSIAGVGIGPLVNDDSIQSRRLRHAREKAGYATAQDAADAFGWKVAGYRHHENGTRGFGADKARTYARAFKVKPGYLLGWDNVDDAPPIDHQASKSLTVGNAVAAGVWHEMSEDFPIFEIDIPPIIPNAKRMGFVVQGHSMDAIYEPGTVLDCISIFTNGVEPENGSLVIALREKPEGLREYTVKEYAIKDGEHYLVPRSTKPEFQEAICIGIPDLEAIDGDQVSIIAFVISDIKPASLRLLERMGKVRRL